MTLQHDDEAFDSILKPLYLTRSEALYLDDSMTMMLESTEGAIPFATMRPMASSLCVPAPVDLIEKIANAVLFTLDVENEGEEARINVNDGDLYCLREVAQSYIMVGTEPVGFNLKKKIFLALYGAEYFMGRQLGDVLDSFTPSTKDTPTSVSLGGEEEF
jgi:hypothetical protein|tara:strand:+ start:703 stop:1182 length:480 start_codon:yes stop_codon:yes gene_type:complete